MRWPLLLIALLAIHAANAIVINEIMYNPDKCSDADCEWVELYNNASFGLDLSNWKIDGKPIDESVGPNSYLIIAKDADAFSLNFDGSCTIVRAAISLTNSEKNISLIDSFGNVADTVFYNSSWGANGNNKTLSLANSVWRESFEDGGTPCAKNFEEHDLEINLEKTDSNEITATITNNGLSDENITLDFYIDSNYSDTQQGFISSFGEADFAFPFENSEIGSHTVTINLTSDFISKTAELNLIIKPLPNADVYAIITIDETSKEYVVRSFPENATTFIGIFVSPHNFNGSEIIFGMFMFGEEFENEVDVSDLISEEIDFGSYDLCAEITDIDNYNDTNLENNFICQQFAIEPESQKRKRIKTFVANENYGLNETLFWTAQIFPLASETVGNLAITLQKRNSQTSYEILKNESLNLTENLILSGNFTIPDGAVEGIYKIRAKFAHESGYFDSQDSGQFWLAGLKDIGPANITLIKYPSALQFGSFGAVFVKFYAGNYDYNKIRLLAYGSPSQVLRDLNHEGLTTSDVANASVAFEIENVRRGQEVYVALPAFTQQNCDANYRDNNYRIRVRAYQPLQAGWTEITTSDIRVPVSGRDVLCISEIKKSSGGNSGRNIVLTKKPKEKAGALELASAPDSASQGELFTAEIKLANNFNAAEYFQVYSYVFEGRELVTEGGWTANSQILKLEPKEGKTISLDNVVKEDAKPGTYTFRARAKFGNLTEDVDKEILVTAESQQEAEAGLGVQSQNLEMPITAAAVWKTSKGGSTNAAAAILIFVLLVVVFALIRSR